MLQDLTALSPQEWDRIITEELAAAGLRPKKFREYDSPSSWVQHTLAGDLGQWALSRDKTVWLLWCKVPLASAEVIASSPLCQTGSIPKQWLDAWKNKPEAAALHTLARLSEFVTWIEGDVTLVKDKGQSNGYKEAIIDDGGHALARGIRFVPDPEAIGEPFIMNYTFYTLEALVRFIVIIKRHRLLPQDTFTNAA